MEENMKMVKKVENISNISNENSMYCLNSLPFPIPYTMEQAHAINALWAQQQIKSQAEIMRMNYEYACKEQLAILKESLDEKKIERREELHRARNMLSFEIFEDPQGFLCKMMTDEKGRNCSYKRICSAQHMRVIEYFSNYKGKRKFFSVIWTVNEKMEKITLKGEDICAEDFAKSLVSRGVVLQTAREYKKNLCDLVWAFLINRAERREIPMSFGWNLVANKWIWTDEIFDGGGI